MAKDPNSVIAGRLAAVRNRMAEWQVDAVYVSSDSNRQWLSGFSGSTGTLLLSEKDIYLSTDSRYWERAVEEAPDCELFRVKGSYNASLQDLVEHVGVSSIGFESDSVTVDQYEKLKELEGVQWKPISGMLTDFRQIKVAEEIEAIKKAASIADQAMQTVNSITKPGMSELQLAWELEKSMREAGASGISFPVIVASGDNASRPHHSPGERKLNKGDVIIIDMGAMVDGYCSDMTRTFLLGDQNGEQFHKIYDIVLEAQEKALDNMHAGMTGKEIDTLSRDVIAGAGYAEEFGHSLGHGVGLEIHELPRLSPLADEEEIREGVVVTVEPGIYIPGWGGVRIEDLVQVTSTGVNILSACPKIPIIQV